VGGEFWTDGIGKLLDGIQSSHKSVVVTFHHSHSKASYNLLGVWDGFFSSSWSFQQFLESILGNKNIRMRDFAEPLSHGDYEWVVIECLRFLVPLQPGDDTSVIDATRDGSILVRMGKIGERFLGLGERITGFEPVEFLRRSVDTVPFPGLCCACAMSLYSFIVCPAPARFRQGCSAPT